MSESHPSPTEATTSTYLWSRLLVEELVRNGVDTFFVAPGSRSTPLTVAAAQNPRASVVLHVDERGNAFATLGYGRATSGPAAWVTTSGTAVANGYPAVVEASVDGVPMVLLTADRPPELRDTGANQTIDQVKFFGDHVRWEVELPAPTEDIDPEYVLGTVGQAVHQARRAPAGPVHINCAYRKPLEPDRSGKTVAVPEVVEEWAQSDRPYTHYPSPRLLPREEDVRMLAADLDAGTRGLVIAGRLDSSEEADAVRGLAEELNWPLIPDVTSRLRLGMGHVSNRVAYADLVLASSKFRARHRPDAVLQFGGRFTSKRLRQFLREAEPEIRAVVRPSPSRVDPDHRASHHIESDIAPFVTQLLDTVDGALAPSGWQEPWARADRRVRSLIDDLTGDARLTEPALSRLLTEAMPRGHALMIGNSMPVRDVNRHGSISGEAVASYANRGASGIDGTVATAAGMALGRDGPTTVVLGDLALWHDLNSLALLSDISVVLVVINNNGGGIFHFLPIREYEDVFEPYFTTPQNRSFRSAAQTFDLHYEQVESSSEFNRAYEDACQKSGSYVIEVQTDRETNRRVHDQLEKRVVRAVEEEL